MNTTDHFTPAAHVHAGKEVQLFNSMYIQAPEDQSQSTGSLKLVASSNVGHQIMLYQFPDETLTSYRSVLLVEQLLQTLPLDFWLLTI